MSDTPDEASVRTCVYVCPESTIPAAVLEKFGLKSKTESASSINVDSQNHAEESAVVRFSGMDVEGISSTPTASQFLVHLCRKHKLLKNEQTTVLSPADQCQALQLCLAQKNQQTGSDFDVDMERVLQEVSTMQAHCLASALSRLGVGGWSHLSEGAEAPEQQADYQTFLEACNHVDLCQLVETVAAEVAGSSPLLSELLKTDMLLLGRPASLLESAVGAMLCHGRPVRRLRESVEEAVEDVSSLFPSNPAAQDSSQTEPIPVQFVRGIFGGYLQLLVNSRSELALATIFNVPDRKLTHSAFTALKHQARQKLMSMYQTASSFVMRLRLGGQSYQPPSNCPLLQHTAGLSQLVDTVHRLLVILEDDPKPGSACRRVVNVIRGLLVKWPGYQLDMEALDTVTSDLHGQLDRLAAEEELRAGTSPEKAVSQGGSLLGRQALRVLRTFLDQTAALHRGDNSVWLQDARLHPDTPTRHPCALSLYRSPVPPAAPSPQTPAPAQAERKKAVTLQHKALSSVTIMEKGGFSQQTRWDSTKLNSIIVLPSKTLVAPAEGRHSLLGMVETVKPAQGKENQHPAVSPVDKQLRKTKRSACPEKSPCGPLLSPRAQAKRPPAKKNCRRRILPQVKGQQSITAFFRV